jgi:glutamate/tyrosine decarboxylase-like PLP-dependent enzyme
MEREVTAQLAAMFGFGTHLGHLTTSGTIANLEALFVARELHPGRGIAFSADAHYTHSRMCGLLGIEGHPVAVDRRGRMDLDALDELLRTGRVGTVVLTAGTTGLGAIDPIHEALGLCRRHGARIHVDAAYGGFFTILARAGGAHGNSAADAREHGTGDTEHSADDTGGLPAAPWRAIAECDSVVVDPHKHGLQPYGCGAVLFRDPGVARFYLHDSPYTYFTSADLHLGEISLECSRAGASAAALWLTFRLLPPTPDGLGQVLAAGRRAALAWSALIGKSDVLELYQAPELDIVSYFPVTGPAALSRIDQASERILQAGMTGPDPVFLSTLRADADAFLARHGSVRADAAGARILRSVLMKPEAEDYVPWLHERVEQLARG